MHVKDSDSDELQLCMLMLDIIHRPSFFLNTTFQRLDLSSSTGE
jgi:hypothetical protein